MQGVLGKRQFMCGGASHSPTRSPSQEMAQQQNVSMMHSMQAGRIYALPDQQKLKIPRTQEDQRIEISADSNLLILQKKEESTITSSCLETTVGQNSDLQPQKEIQSQTSSLHMIQQSETQAGTTSKSATGAKGGNNQAPVYEYLESMLSQLIDEFNCNHQADLDSENQQKIYNREDEHAKVRNFLQGNIRREKSGLLYMCGHPGTGKTSSLNYVLSKMRRENQDKCQFKALLFNAMAYPDVKTFALQLHEKLHEEFLGGPPKRNLNRSNVDDEDLAIIIERLLTKISTFHKKNACAPLPHKIIVIDEVDCFQSNEKAFTALVKQILKKGNQGEKNQTHTSIVGIANSVDLPFRKKHSAIAMRDCMLLFQPYSMEDIENIVEEKKNSLFTMCVPEDHESRLFLKDVFFKIIDERAMQYLCKRISQSTGDIRVAFDVVKSALQQLHAIFKDIKENESIPNLDVLKKTLVITPSLLVKIFDAHKGPKLSETLSTLPRQNIQVLDAVQCLFHDMGEERRLPLDLLFTEVHKNNRRMGFEKMDNNQVISSIDQISQYGIIEIIKNKRGNKKDFKFQSFELKVDLRELKTLIDEHPIIDRVQKDDSEEELEIVPDVKPQSEVKIYHAEIQVDPTDMLKSIMQQNKKKLEEEQDEEPLSDYEGQSD